MIESILSHTDISEEYSNKIRNGYLELKSISNITDEDRLKISEICYGTANISISEILLNYLFFNQDGDIELYLPISPDEVSQIYDYLRSKGYALPYLDLSIEDLISYGWIKLIEN